MTAADPLAPAPAALAGAGGEIPFGRYAGPIADTRTDRWDGGLPSRRRTQRKGWLYLGAVTDRYLVGYAVADAGLLGVAFAYAFDRERRVLVEEKVTVPLGFPGRFQPALRGAWSLGRGGRRWSIDHAGGSWRARFTGRRLSLDLEMTDEGGGMSTLAPSPGRPFNYTYKACAQPVQARLTLDGRRDERAGLGVVDFTLGYPPRHTFWNWAALVGTTADGRSFGLNLVAHFNNGLENALWVGGRVAPLGQALFQYDAADLQRPWRVTTADGVIDLRFTPEGRRAEDIDLGLLVSRFSQPFGRCEGTLRIDGAPVAASGAGVVEEHRAVW